MLEYLIKLPKDLGKKKIKTKQEEFLENLDRFPKYIFTGLKSFGSKPVPTWTYDWSFLNRSKYVPHQSSRECSRRLKQCSS